MRVIQATDFGSPFAGSFAPMLSSALTATRERGWEPLAVLPERARGRDWLPAFEAAHGEELVFAPEGGRLELTRWLSRLVRSAPGPTLLHTHFSTFDLPAAALARRDRDTRALWHLHTVFSDTAKARIRNRLRFTVAGRYVERILCVGPNLVEGAVARGAPAAKVEYFPNGVDSGRFPGPASPEERAAARAALGLEPSATVLLHIGRDWRLKGGDLFLDVYERLDRSGLVALLVRGGDVARREVVRRGLAGRAIVLEGTSDVRTLHAASDLMLATSRGEGALPLAVVEALSSGLAVVATDIPGHALPGGAPPGLRIAPVDPEAITAAAGPVLDRDAGSVRDEGALAHAWVSEKLGLQAWSSRLMDLYEHVRP